MIRKTVADMMAYSTTEIPMTARLHANELPWDWVKEYESECVEIIKNTFLNHYPDGSSSALRERLSQYAGVPAETIVVGNGSDELIKMVLEISLEPGDAIVVHSPTFSEYGAAATIVGGRVVSVASLDNFGIDVDGIIEAANAEQAKVVFLCTPNNPTGVVIPPETVRRVLRETSGFVVCDEAYYEFDGGTVAADATLEPRLIVLRTLSKAFGMAALRVGYAIAAPSTAEALNKVRLPYNINSLTQNMAMLGLKYQSRSSEYVETICQERDRLNQALRQLGSVGVFEGKGNFVLLKTPAAGAIQEKLEALGIGIRRFQSKEMEGCLRITVGTPETNNVVLKTIAEVLDAERKLY